MLGLLAGLLFISLGCLLALFRYLLICKSYIQFAAVAAAVTASLGILSIMTFRYWESRRRKRALTRKRIAHDAKFEFVRDTLKKVGR